MQKRATLKSRHKREVMVMCGGLCENSHCDAEANSVHHFFKASCYPEYQYDPDNGCGLCGPCHSEVERRERMGMSIEDLIPMDRYAIMEDKMEEGK